MASSEQRYFSFSFNYCIFAKNSGTGYEHRQQA